MPKVTINNPEATRGAIIFGDKLTPVNLSVLSHCTGIPVSTLAGYKARPDTIPLGRLARIVKARHLTEEEVYKLIRGK